jgi:multidrug resistance efflux pump
VHRSQAEDCRREKEELVRKIYEEKELIAKQQKEWELCEKDIDRLEALKEKSKVSEELYKFKAEALQAARLKQAEARQMLGEER